MKKSQGSSARGAVAGKNEKSIKPKKDDFSDIPELSDEQLSSTRRVGRASVGDEPRKLIAIRLDVKVGWLRKTAKKKGLPYQSLVNEILAGESGRRVSDRKRTNIHVAEEWPVLGLDEFKWPPISNDIERAE